MDVDKIFIKCIVIVVISVAICMTISSVTSSVVNYHLGIQAMKSGYVQQRSGSYSNKLMWVKENEKEN